MSDLKGNLKNLLSDKSDEVVNEKLVKAAMSVKIKDEQITKGKLVRARNLARSELMKKLGTTSKRYKTVI